MILLYAATSFVSAALLFVIQPMFARMVLPLLGGSPAVWNTSMVFYQAVLLAGYGYAHAVGVRMRVRSQILLHLPVLAIPAVLLPLGVSHLSSPPAQGSPVPWLFLLMASSVALPFFALSTTAPLVQKWFGSTRHPWASDPYFLYVASNAGSMLGLLSYPFLIEPYFTLEQQSLYWAYGYGFLVLLLSASTFCTWKVARSDSRGRALSPGDATGESSAPITNALRARWILLAFLPSSLMLGVTTFISSEVAAVPLMWIVPLALYLLTFVVAFSRRQIVSCRLLVRVLPICLIIVVVLINMRATQPIGPLMLIHLFMFLVAAQLCHSTLAEIRPAVEKLTEFYLCLCVGGVLGGVFNALIAPIVFDSIAEYPVAIVLVCFATLQNRGGTRLARVADWGLPLGLTVVAWALVRYADKRAELSALEAAAVFGAPAVVCYLFSNRAIRFGVGVVGLFVAGALYDGQKGHVLFAERSFFGVHRVTLDPTGGYHMLFHGSTLHGMQSLDATRRRESLTYYHATGPIGQVLDVYGRGSDLRVAAVGLGAGSIAAFAQPGQSWTYYEIDPVVARVATDDRFFTFLRDAATSVRIELGDARLTLKNEADGAFDLLILDAYSSDAIPVHLVTREALQLYLLKLAPTGRMAYHISNLHLDLEPVFANLAAEAGLVCLVRDDTSVDEGLAQRGKSPSVWMVMARAPSNVERLRADPLWRAARTDPSIPMWTDDYSSIWSVFQWH